MENPLNPAIDLTYDDLLSLKEKLKQNNFCGTIIEKWHMGQVTQATVDQVLKPVDFQNVVVIMSR